MEGIGVAYGKHTLEAKGSRLFLPFLLGRNWSQCPGLWHSGDVYLCNRRGHGASHWAMHIWDNKTACKTVFWSTKTRITLSSPLAYSRAASKDKIQRLKTENCWEADLQSMVTKYVYWQCCSATAAIEERRKTPQHSKITAVTMLSSVWTHVSRLSAWTLMLRKHKCLLQLPTSWQIDISNAQPDKMHFPHLDSR